MAKELGMHNKAKAKKVALQLLEVRSSTKGKRR